ncbi:MAG: hypothetical protein LBP79_00495 [Clostridiales bacterium]|jgi:hypothetical protein|nr:hypothetical protein [Clostridiales bacterium]
MIKANLKGLIFSVTVAACVLSAVFFVAPGGACGFSSATDTDTFSGGAAVIAADSDGTKFEEIIRNSVIFNNTERYVYAPDGLIKPSVLAAENADGYAVTFIACDTEGLVHAGRHTVGFTFRIEKATESYDFTGTYYTEYVIGPMPIKFEIKREAGKITVKNPLPDTRYRLLYGGDVGEWQTEPVFYGLDDSAEYTVEAMPTGYASTDYLLDRTSVRAAAIKNEIMIWAIVALAVAAALATVFAASGFKKKKTAPSSPTGMVPYGPTVPMPGYSVPGFPSQTQGRTKNAQAANKGKKTAQAKSANAAKSAKPANTANETKAVAASLKSVKPTASKAKPQERAQATPVKVEKNQKAESKTNKLKESKTMKNEPAQAEFAEYEKALKTAKETRAAAASAVKAEREIGERELKNARAGNAVKIKAARAGQAAERLAIKDAKAVIAKTVKDAKKARAKTLKNIKAARAALIKTEKAKQAVKAKAIKDVKTGQVRAVKNAKAAQAAQAKAIRAEQLAQGKAIKAAKTAQVKAIKTAKAAEIKTEKSFKKAKVMETAQAKAASNAEAASVKTIRAIRAASLKSARNTDRAQPKAEKAYSSKPVAQAVSGKTAAYGTQTFQVNASAYGVQSIPLQNARILPAAGGAKLDVKSVSAGGKDTGSLLSASLPVAPRYSGGNGTERVSATGGKAK